MLTIENSEHIIKRSLKRVALRSILFGALIFFILMIFTEMIIFVFPTLWHYKHEMEHNEAYLTDLIGMPYIEEILTKTREIYDAAPEELKQKQFESEYKDLFTGLIDDDFFAAREYLEKCRIQTGKVNCFLCFYDEEKDRVVFVVDGNDAKLAFIPGQWISEENGSIDDIRTIKRTVNSEWYLHVTYGKAWGLTATDYMEIKNSDGKTIGYMTITISMNSFARKVARVLVMNIPFFIVNIMIFIYLISDYMIKRVITPINRLAEAAKEYGSINKNQVNPKGRVFPGFEINTEDEIEQLWKTMVDMENDISAAMSKIAEAAAKEERLAAELDLAKSIQLAALPTKFPDREEFDIFASMIPAKEVGGDFYDFFFIDNDHLGMVIADVSGKGVPAALFMMTCKAIIKGTALRGGTPAEILSYVNDRLQEDNESDMFVTVWLGMLDISTGVVTACSAGHEYPFVTDEYGNYQKLEDPHGVVCGVLQNLSYEDYSFTIPGNGRLFVYTDGVAEALNKDDEMFGTDRLRNCLNANNSADPAEVVAAMRKELTTFADGAEQFDDVTMLSLWYKGQHN